jgi:hypothetical protein
MVVTAIALGILFFAGITGLFYVFLGWAEDILSARPDANLIAMERLIASGEIVLTVDQKEKITPIVEELAKENLCPEQKAALEGQLWSALEPEKVRS